MSTLAGVQRAIKHGTIGGYVAHRRRGETACSSCRLAWRLYYRNRNGTVPRVILNSEKSAASYRAKRRKETRDAWNRANPDRPRKAKARPTAPIEEDS